MYPEKISARVRYVYQISDRPSALGASYSPLIPLEVELAGPNCTELFALPAVIPIRGCSRRRCLHHVGSAIFRRLSSVEGETKRIPVSATI